MKVSLTHKLLLVVAIPLAIHLVFIAIMSNELARLAVAQNLAQHYLRVVLARDRFIISERQRTLLIADYLSTLDELRKQKYFETQVDSREDLRELSLLWKTDPARTLTLDKLKDMFQQRDQMTLSVLAKMNSKMLTVEDLLGGFTGQNLMLRRLLLSKKVPWISQYFDQDQEQKLIYDAAVQQNVNEIFATLVAGLVALLSASLVSGLLFSLSVSRRLKVVLSNIDALVNNKPDLVNIKGQDEISDLNRAVVTTATKIRDAEEFQAQTIAIIADELNKPLTDVAAALQELPKSGFESLTEKGQKRLNDSNAEIERLESLVLELINLDAAARKMEIVQTDIAELTANSVKIVEQLTKLKSVSITVSSVENAIAFADRDKTTQVLINFLSNAIKYSPEGSTIEISIGKTGHEVTISICDHGAGIPMEFHSRIFKRFEQAESSAQKSGSSGLGLKISKEIVESQGGQVGFSSKVGEGSTFWFSLPTIQNRTQGDAASTTSNARRGWKSTLWKKALLVMALPMVIQGATIAALFNFLHQSSEKIAELTKIQKVTELHAALMTGISSAGILSMLYNTGRNPRDLEDARAENKALRQNIAELQRLTDDEKGQDPLTAKLLAAVNAHTVLEEHLIKAGKNAKVEQFVGVNGSDKSDNLMVDTRGPLLALKRHQNELIENNALASEEIRHNFEILLFLSAISASLVAGTLGFLIAKSLTSRATSLSRAALRFSESRELPQELAGDDELAFVEQQLHSAGKKLMELEVARAEMIGITSHELRTPLTSLIALIDVLEAGIFGEVTARGRILLAKARLQTSELVVLITNLLDLEKMESGKILVTKQKIKVEKIFEQIESENSLPAEEKGVSLKIQECDQEVLGDSNRLSQALTAVIRSILERLPRHSDVWLQCKTSQDMVSLTIGAPHGVAVKSYRNKHRELAREQMAISLASLTAIQHGGNLQLTTSSKGRTIEIRLPAGV